MVFLFQVLTAPNDRFKARLKLWHIKGLDQVIIGARFKSFEFVGQRSRAVSMMMGVVTLASSQTLAYRQAINTGQHHVQYDGF